MTNLASKQDKEEPIWHKLSFNLPYKCGTGFDQQLKDLNIRPLLIIGCGHDNNNYYRQSNCTSKHIGVITIDRDPDIKPDFVININSPDLTIVLGYRFKKIVFDGYHPSFWNPKVIQFLLKNLAKDGNIYASGSPEVSSILTFDKFADEQQYEFIHKYTKIFDYETLNTRLDRIVKNYYEPRQELTISVTEAINKRSFKEFVYLIEQQEEHISRADAYKIARSDNLEFLKYLVENTEIIAILCSPNDINRNYHNFLNEICFGNDNIGVFLCNNASALREIKILYDLFFLDSAEDMLKLLVQKESLQLEGNLAELKQEPSMTESPYSEALHKLMGDGYNLAALHEDATGGREIIGDDQQLL